MASSTTSHAGILPDGVVEGDYADDLAQLAAHGQFDGCIENRDMRQDTVPPWLILHQMGKLKIGKASTYGGSLRNLVQAGFITWKNQEVSLTLDGRTLVERLEKYAPVVSDPEFSSRLSKRLDRAEECGEIASVLIAYAVELGWAQDEKNLRSRTGNTPEELNQKILEKPNDSNEALIGTF